MADHTPPPVPAPAPPPPRPPVHVHHDQLPEQHPERHEHTDVSIKGIWITAAALVVVSLIVFVMLYVVFFLLEDAQKQEDDANRRSAIVAKPEDRGPPRGVPRLQGIAGYHSPTPSQDTLTMKAENLKHLGSYGPTGRDGVAHIPVDRAMDLALQNNLFPARAPTTQPGGADAGH